MMENETEAPCSCEICDKKFCGSKSLRRHQVKFHGAEVRKNQACLEPGCNKAFSVLYQLKKHLKIDHGKEIAEHLLQFQDYDEFLRWKGEEEERTQSSYTLFQSKGGMNPTRLYACHRSGPYRPRGQGKRSLKRQGSCKIGRLCTARMRATDMGGYILVNYTSTHYGHDWELGHLTLRPEQRAEIASMLAQGMDYKHILSSIRDSCSDRLERVHLLTTKDLENIQREFNLEYNKSDRTDIIDTSLLLSRRSRKRDARDMQFSRIIKLMKGKKGTSVDDGRHSAGSEISKSNIHYQNHCWLVSSQHKKDTVYEVRRVECPMSSCDMICVHCNACIHMFHCTCTDSIVKGNMCKHCHAVALYGETFHEIQTVFYSTETPQAVHEEIVGSIAQKSPGEYFDIDGMSASVLQKTEQIHKLVLKQQKRGYLAQTIVEQMKIISAAQDKLLKLLVKSGHTMLLAPPSPSVKQQPPSRLAEERTNRRIAIAPKSPAPWTPKIKLPEGNTPVYMLDSKTQTLMPVLVVPDTGPSEDASCDDDSSQDVGKSAHIKKKTKSSRKVRNASTLMKKLHRKRYNKSIKHCIFRDRPDEINGVTVRKSERIKIKKESEIKHESEYEDLNLDEEISKASLKTNVHTEKSKVDDVIPLENQKKDVSDVDPVATVEIINIDETMFQQVRENFTSHQEMKNRIDNDTGELTMEGELVEVQVHRNQDVVVPEDLELSEVLQNTCYNVLDTSHSPL